MKSIKVMTDYNCMPLWHYRDNEVGDIDPSSLPLSKELVSNLMAWAADYDATLNQETPQESGFDTSDAESAFVEKGLTLAQNLKSELSDCEVYYFHEGMGREVRI